MYIKTKKNPADLATRGVSVGDLNDKKDWWHRHGPEWLCKPQEEWPEWIISDVTIRLRSQGRNQRFHYIKCRYFPSAGRALKDQGTIFQKGWVVDSLHCANCCGLQLCVESFEHFRKRIKPQGAGSLTQKSVPNRMPILTARDLMVEREFWDYMVQKEIFSEVTDAIRRRKYNSTANSLGLVIDED